jgi:hypothetical protein
VNDHCYLECNTTGNDPNDYDAGIWNFGDPVHPIPELSTLILFGVGLVTVAGYVRQRRKRKD